MPTEDFITALFCRIDDALEVKKDKRAHLYSSELVTLAILFALKGVGNRAFYRWIRNTWRPWFPQLPERTRLFRLFKTHREWANRFLADPTLLGVIDSYGIEFIYPIREGRSPRQLGKKGVSNHRWMVGGKLCLLLNNLGVIVGWACDTANVHDATFHPLVEEVQGEMIVLADNGFHAQTGDPPNLKLCDRGEWNM